VFDETLYLGSAAHYPVGRMAYPTAVAGALRDELGLDGAGRLLDVGCGPGSLTLLLAPLFDAAVGIDADAGMIAEARGRAPHVDWHVLRAEELPAGLGTFRVVTFAQSFHWMDQPLVADRVRGMLAGGGTWVHVGATTHRGAATDEPMPHPQPPWDAIDDLVTAYLGPERRGSRSGEEDVMRAAGYRGPTRLIVGGGVVVERTADEIVSAVFSLSNSTPHLLGDRAPAFERDLRAILGRGPFCERTREAELVIWKP
jgi:SAM-dependent methyltransferase